MWDSERAEAALIRALFLLCAQRQASEGGWLNPHTLHPGLLFYAPQLSQSITF
jgi:hypothetical protein